MREARVVVQTEELQEALELFIRWEGRKNELPPVLRAELEALARSPPVSIATVEMVGQVCQIILAPRLRALVGNLRAREPSGTYPALQL
jgi:hypothetical protein